MAVQEHDDRSTRETLTPEQDCARVHELLRHAMALLDAGFRAPELRAQRARLIERGTIACVNARLLRHGDMRADLQGMLSDALEMPAEPPDETSTLRLRRLIRQALADNAGPDV